MNQMLSSGSTLSLQRVISLVPLSRPNWRCTTPVVPKTQSTNRDVIFHILVTCQNPPPAERIAANILLVRNCGCAARIVLLLESSYVLPDVIQAALTDVRAEIVRVDFQRKFDGVGLADEMRLVWMNQWLLAHRGEIDRVLYNDLYDTIYYQDPFGYMFYPGKLTFVSEQLIIRDSPWNRDTIDKCYGQGAHKRVEHGPVICSGVYGGYLDPFLRFVELMLGNNSHMVCKLDQPQMNYMAHTGYFRNAGLSYVIIGPETAIHTIGSPYILHVGPDGMARQIRTGRDTLPVLVHHANRPAQTKELPEKMCRIDAYMKVAIAKKQ